MKIKPLTKAERIAKRKQELAHPPMDALDLRGLQRLVWDLLNINKGWKPSKSSLVQVRMYEATIYWDSRERLTA